MVWLYTNPRGQKSKELSKRAFQQVRTYGSLRFKGTVSDHGSTALAVTYIGYGVKTPTNLGLSSSGGAEKLKPVPSHTPQLQLWLLFCPFVVKILNFKRMRQLYQT